MLGQATNVTKGLVLWYPLTNSSGTNITDSSGSGNNGSLLNGPTSGSPEWVSGIVGNALSINNPTNAASNTNEYVYAADAPSLNFSNAFTIAAWVNCDTGVSGTANSEPAGAGILDKGPGRYQAYAFDLYGGLLRFYYQTNYNLTGATVSSTFKLTNGIWYHIVGVWSAVAANKQFVLYINGVTNASLASSSVGTNIPYYTTNGVNIGCRQSAANGPYNYPFQGLVDDVRIYNRALSYTEVTNLYGLAFLQKPTLLAQPQSLTRYTNDSAFFTVTANSVVQPYYQWRLNGTNLANANGSFLSLSNLQFADAGSYTVVVTNAYGAVTSSPAILTVYPLPPPDVTNNQIAYWKYDETSGYAAYDSSGNGQTATLYGFANNPAQWVTGAIGGALQFNADGSAADTVASPGEGISDNGLFDFSTGKKFSLTCWVKGSFFQSNVVGIIAKGTGDGGEQYCVDLTGGNYRFFVRDSGGVSHALVSDAGPDGLWQHLACVFNATNGIMGIYVDGSLANVMPPPLSLLSNQHEISIGNRQPSTGAYAGPWTGAIDDVHIYNRDLNSGDVQQLYQAGPAEVIEPASSYSALRQTWFNLLTGGTNLNTADTNLAIALNQTSSLAQGYWSTMNTATNRTCLWSDLPAVTTNGEQMWFSYKRLRAMALAYATTGSSLQGSAAMNNDLISALDWMNTNSYNTSKSEDNWWYWEIGAPLALNDTVVLLYSNLSGSQITNYMDVIDYFCPEPAGTGANQVWEATVVAVRGAIVQDGNKIASASASLSEVFPYVTSSDGFYTDGSFVQHGIFAYTGSYGSSLISELAPLLQMLTGSPWAVTDPNLQNVYQWVSNTYQPVIYNGEMMDMVRGRAIAREDETDQIIGQQAIAAILQIAQFAPSSNAATFDDMADYWVQTDTTLDFLTNAGLSTINAGLTGIVQAEALMSNANVVSRGPLVGHYTFGSMDRVVHLRPSFGFGISMSSSRIANYESINTENLHGWYTGDGMTYLYNSDQTQFSDSFWPTVNPYQLPGTTVGTQTRANSSGAGYLSSNNWVGGATLNDRYGAAGMQLHTWNSTLVANKSWFMFDDEIVFLGAGITSTDNKEVETIVENRKLTSAGTNVFMVNGAEMPGSLGWAQTMPNVSWAHLDGNVPGSDLGYYFPQPAALNGLRQASSGSWFAIDPTEYLTTTNQTRNYLALWYNHGTNPVNSTYAYVLLPGMSAVATGNYAANPPISVLQNSPSVQAVAQIPLGLTAANFWSDGTQSTGPITVNRKAAVLLQLTETNLAVAVADPTHTNTAGVIVTIGLPVAGVLSLDAGVTVNQTTPSLQLNVNTAGGAGRSYQAKFLYNVTNFASFQKVHFSAAQLIDAAISGASADPANDGINNLMKYALMLDPWQTYSAGLQFGDADGHFTLTYARRKLAADLTYTMEVSNDLRSWDASETQFTQTVVADDGTAQTIQVTDNATMDSLATRYFCLFVTFKTP